MDADTYQQHAARTLTETPGITFDDANGMLLWNALGLAGEAGEIADYVKKGLFHHHGIDREVLLDEIGDCLWYLAALCTGADASLSDVMARNVAKLQRRYPEGFSAEARRGRTP